MVGRKDTSVKESVHRKKEPSEIDSEKHLKTYTGTRNPYALAERKLGFKVDWRGTSPKIAQKLLKETFKIEYHNIFIPGFHSPIFMVPKKGGKVNV